MSSMKSFVIALAMLPRSSSATDGVSGATHIAARWPAILQLYVRRQKNPSVNNGMMIKSSLDTYVSMDWDRDQAILSTHFLFALASSFGCQSRSALKPISLAARLPLPLLYGTSYFSSNCAMTGGLRDEERRR